MSGFPEPPKPARAYTEAEAAEVRPVFPEPPPAPEIRPALLGDGESALTSDETALILRKTLRREHLEDPHVLRFIDRYLVCRDVPQTCAEVGIPRATGVRFLRTPEIYEAINQITQKATMKYGYDAAEVVERTKELVAFDPIVFENPDGTYKTHLSQIPPEARRAIKKFKVKNIWGEDPNGMKTVIGQLMEIEVHEKYKGIELLAREKNTFKETKKIEHDVTARMGSILLEAGHRAEQRALMDVRPVMKDVTATVVDVTPGAPGVEK